MLGFSIRYFLIFLEVVSMSKKSRFFAFVSVCGLLVVSYQSFGSAAPVAAFNCMASDFNELNTCLAQAVDPSRDLGVQLDILLTSDLVLDLGQVIRMNDVENISLRGAGGPALDQPISITETNDRMNQADASLSGPNNKTYIEIGGRSRNVKVSNFEIKDAPGSETFLRNKCRTGGNPDPSKPNLWDIRHCHAPVLVGSSRMPSTAYDYTKDIEINRINVDTNKAILMEVRRTRGLAITNSSFGGAVHGGGTVYGVLFSTKFHHVNTVISGNHFQHAGTAALSLFNAFNTLIQHNTFVDNHIDPQYIYHPTPTTNAYFPGGQLYIADSLNAPNTFVRIFNNDISMTPAYTGHCATPPLVRTGCRSTTGIEIMNGERAVVSDVLVEGNRVHDLPRNGIAVHNSSHLNQHRITIRNNRLFDNYLDFASINLPVAAFIQLETAPGIFPNPLHPNVDLDSNQLWRSGQPSVTGSFLDSPKSCSVFGPQPGRCTVTLLWEITRLPPGAIPVIKVDNVVTKTRVLIAAYGHAANGSVVVPWILEDRNHTFGLYLNSADEYPLAMINVMGIRPTGSR
jgi:hypothetical protein